jgi:4'-phosphopantetheinyl transferase
VPAERVELSYGHRGKPALGASHAAPALRFNLAHSDGLGLCAVASSRDVGVDIERLRPDFADDGAAEHFFSRAEVTALRTLHGERRARAFFDCWTRKEAYIKARGDGLWLPLDRFEVSLEPGDPPALLATHDEPAEAARWSLLDLDAGPDYAATVAVEGRGWRLQRWQWPEGLHSTSP